jgi:hypothetical protein
MPYNSHTKTHTKKHKNGWQTKRSQLTQNNKKGAKRLPSVSPNLKANLS